MGRAVRPRCKVWGGRRFRERIARRPAGLPHPHAIILTFPRPASLLPASLALAVFFACAAPAWAQPKAPAAAAVFPFTAQRNVEQSRWLAAFLQEELTRSLRRWGQFPLPGPEPAALWQRKFGLRGLEPPEAAQLRRMGVEVVLHGTSQLVLGLALIKMRVTGAEGELLPDGTATFRIELKATAPIILLAQVLGKALAGLSSKTPYDHPPEPLPQPAGWRQLWRYYKLRSTPHAPWDAAALARRMARLEKLAEEPALQGRVAAALAGILLEAALLDTEDRALRRGRLDAALRWAAQAVQIEPWNGDALALKGELHHFLRQEYDARTEASIARVKDPLNGLAYVVLALAAGLSTGEAAQHMKRALAVDPFLWKKNRPPEGPAFQNGVLEPVIEKWQALRAKARRRRKGSGDPRLAQGIALFENKKWTEAEKALLEAAAADEYSHAPLLYLARIQIETGNPEAASAQLRKLAVEFPQEAEIYYYLGIALERGEAYAEAIAAFQQSLREDPEYSLALLHIGTAALGGGQWERAREALRNFLSRDNRNAEGWLSYGIANARLERWEAADEAFREALNLQPGMREALRWRTEIRPRLPR